jgi:hypothetical protein
MSSPLLPHSRGLRHARTQRAPTLSLRSFKHLLDHSVLSDTHSLRELNTHSRCSFKHPRNYVTPTHSRCSFKHISFISFTQYSLRSDNLAVPAPTPFGQTILASKTLKQSFPSVIHSLRSPQRGPVAHAPYLYPSFQSILCLVLSIYPILKLIVRIYI